MKSKDIKKIIRTKIQEGKSHQQIYDELNVTFPNREIDIARMVGGEVTLAQQEKFKVWNWALIALVGVVALANIVIALIKSGGTWSLEVFIASAISIACAVMVVYLYKWHLSAYLTVDFLAAISMVEISSATVTFHIDASEVGSYALIALATYLYSQLGGSFRSKSTQYKDAKGQIRARHAVTFKE